VKRLIRPTGSKIVRCDSEGSALIGKWLNAGQVIGKAQDISILSSKV